MQRLPVRTLSTLALASLATASSASAQCANLWPVGENGTINGNDKAAGIIVWNNPDQSSDEYVFVAGTRATGPSTSEIVVCKYDVPCGNLIWRQTYAGPASGINEAVDIGIGFQQFEGDPTDPNIPPWKEWYVYVTGVSYGGTSGLDYVTLKINAQENIDLVDNTIQADGSYSTRWPVFGPGHIDYDANDPNYAHAIGVRRYTNTAIAGGVDRPARIGVDANDDPQTGWTAHSPGDVYVFGTSDGGGTGKDYALILYNAEGQRAWKTSSAPDIGQGGEARYDRAGADDVAADLCFKYFASTSGTGLPDISIYVTGTAYSGSVAKNDYATMMYGASDGALLFLDIYNSLHDGNDVAVALDASGNSNVVVTGTSDEPPPTGFFDPTPTLPAKTDYLTICYDPVDLWRNWEERFDFDNHDQAADVQVYEDGELHFESVWVTGAVAATSPGAADFGTVKYIYEDSAISVDWYDRLDFESGDDRPASMRLDHRSCNAGALCGAVYITGSAVRNGATDYVTFRYETDKTHDPLDWPRYYDGLGDGADAAVRLDFGFQDLPIDGYPHVYVVGTSAGNGTQNDIVTQRIMQQP